MTKSDGEKVKNFIETYYKTKLTEDEIIALSRELKEYNYERFNNEIKDSLLYDVKYFTIAALHSVIQQNSRINKILKDNGKSSWNEFYANKF